MTKNIKNQVVRTIQGHNKHTFFTGSVINFFIAELIDYTDGTGIATARVQGQIPTQGTLSQMKSFVRGFLIDHDYEVPDVLLDSDEVYRHITPNNDKFIVRTDDEEVHFQMSNEGFTYQEIEKLIAGLRRAQIRIEQVKADKKLKLKAQIKERRDTVSQDLYVGAPVYSMLNQSAKDRVNTIIETEDQLKDLEDKLEGLKK